MRLRSQLNTSCVLIVAVLTLVAVRPSVHTRPSAHATDDVLVAYDTPVRPSVIAAADGALELDAYLRSVRMARIVALVRGMAAADRPTGSSSVPASPPAGDTVAVPRTIVSVMACIRSVESGNYGESAHPGGASGAYQYEPATWQAWFGRWVAATGYAGPTYELAYQAPPTVQDAVTAFTLTHGGAGNWSSRYGPDSCTAGIAGGG